MSKEVILTGLRTNSTYHLGNYIGGLLPLKRLVKEKLKDDPDRYQFHLFVPDLHGFTTPIEFESYYQKNNYWLKADGRLRPTARV